MHERDTYYVIMINQKTFLIPLLTNPKEPGSIKYPGEMESTHFGKRSLTPPNFHPRPPNSISYES